MEKETRKELIKKFRKQVAGGKTATRAQLLAYAFLRGKEYVALERVINEDHESFEVGRNTFLWYLAGRVATEIAEAKFGQKSYELRKAGELETVKEFVAFNDAVKKEIQAWIQEKYAAKDDSKEAAA